MTVATLLTLTRIALIPVFAVLWLHGRHEAALWAFAIAAISDGLDGLAARLLDQRTRLGALLDPAADKLMLLVSFLVAASVGAVPVWLAVLVIGRDLLVSLGAGALLLLRRGRLPTERLLPTRIGKYATVLESLTILLPLLAGAALVETGPMAPRAPLPGGAG